MSENIKRTYSFNPKVVDWIDSFAAENNVDKSFVANRGVKVYAAKISKNEWKDPRFQDTIDRKFEDL
jgi:hypothetical protein